MEAFETADNPLLNRRSFLEESFRSIIIVPFETILTPIAAFYFFNIKKNNSKFSFELVWRFCLLIGKVDKYGNCHS